MSVTEKDILEYEKKALEGSELLGILEIMAHSKFHYIGKTFEEIKAMSDGEEIIRIYNNPLVTSEDMKGIEVYAKTNRVN